MEKKAKTKVEQVSSVSTQTVVPATRLRGYFGVFKMWCPRAYGPSLIRIGSAIKKNEMLTDLVGKKKEVEGRDETHERLWHL